LIAWWLILQKDGAASGAVLIPILALAARKDLASTSHQQRLIFIL
jgi:hypothetical protein